MLKNKKRSFKIICLALTVMMMFSMISMNVVEIGDGQLRVAETVIIDGYTHIFIELPLTDIMELITIRDDYTHIIVESTIADIMETIITETGETLYLYSIHVVDGQFQATYLNAYALANNPLARVTETIITETGETLYVRFKEVADSPFKTSYVITETGETLYVHFREVVAGSFKTPFEKTERGMP